jgi:hypothetical protein
VRWKPTADILFVTGTYTKDAALLHRIRQPPGRALETAIFHGSIVPRPPIQQQFPNFLVTVTDLSWGTVPRVKGVYTRCNQHKRGKWLEVSTRPTNDGKIPLEERAGDEDRIRC